jgi:hypothetical protein
MHRQIAAARLLTTVETVRLYLRMLLLLLLSQ